MASSYERILCVKNEVFVFKIPPITSNRGYRAAEWSLDKPNWTGRLKVVAGSGLCIKLEDRTTGELFANCPVDTYPGPAVEPVLDSSRYFVLRLKNDLGRCASVGIGFSDRGDSFDMNVTIQDYFRGLQQQEAIDKSTEDFFKGPKLDLGFKQGETIRINIGKKKNDEETSQPKSASSTVNPILLPPPPSGNRVNRVPQSSAPNVISNNEPSSDVNAFSKFDSLFS